MRLDVVRTRVLLYVRRSKSETVRSRSVAAQERVARADAARMHWVVVGVHDDDGYSASRHARTTRKGWPDVVRDLRAGRADVLWLLDSSRGDRQLAPWIELLDYCRDNDILIYLHLSKRSYDLLPEPTDAQKRACQCKRIEGRPFKRDDLRFDRRTL